MYNFCSYILFRLELKYLHVEEQQKMLKPLNLIPFKYRLFFSFSLFSRKILNRYFLLSISDLLKPIVKNVNTREKSTDIFVTPLVTSKSGANRIQ